MVQVPSLLKRISGSLGIFKRCLPVAQGEIVYRQTITDRANCTGMLVSLGSSQCLAVVDLAQPMEIEVVAN